MSLQNLLAIRRLQEQRPDHFAVRKLLQAARRNLADAQVTVIGADLRFDAAYKCIMQCAMLGLLACGFRTSTSQPGHHQTAIQCLALTMGLPGATIIVLDGLRKRRNLSDYEGDPVSESTLATCIDQAASLLEHTEQWLRSEHPQLMEEP